MKKQLNEVTLESYRELYLKAAALVKANPDGSYSETKIKEKLKTLIDIREDDVRSREAQRILDALCKASSDEAQGWLHFEDYGSWAYEPLRLIRSGTGTLIENCKATIEYKMADAQRSEKHAEETHQSSRRKRREADVLAEWTVKKMGEGWEKTNCTWGACIEDLGIHDPFGDEVDSEPK